jgi:hypothetical protein
MDRFLISGDPMTPQGIHRIENPEGIEDAVWVIDAGMSFEVYETAYIEKGYGPSIETLPWEPRP